MVPGVKFTLPAKGEEGYAEVQPWVELVQDGSFSKETLELLPVSYQTTDAWLELVEKSASKDLTWLHSLHLAIAYTERGAINEPKKLYQYSMKMKPNPIAARCLAVLESTNDAAWKHFQEAWAARKYWEKDPAYSRLTANLVTEISFFLIQAEWYDEMTTFAAQVPSEHRNLDAYLTMQSKLYLHTEKYQETADLLSANCFPTFAKARDELMSMWNEAQEGIAMQKKGSELTYTEKHRARVDHPIPDNIGCQYASEYCTNYW